MVHFGIFDPARTLRQLVHLIHTRPKRNAQARRITVHGPTSKSPAVVSSPTVDVTFTKNYHKFELHEHSEVYDDMYYPSFEETRGDEESYCTLKMENTLFKVHKSVLMRGNCVFSDWKFVQGGSHPPKYLSTPVIHLPENAGRFRDLLWALHKLDLEDPRFIYEPSIYRLLNIAELSHKYRFLDYEKWSVDQLYRLCASGPLPFSLSSPRDSSSSITLTECVAEDVQNVDSICSRLLQVAYTSRHASLFLLIIKKLVVQSLWHEFHPGPTLLETIEHLGRCRSRFQRHVQQLLGVVNYRMLVDMEFTIATDKSPVVLFPHDMDVERRMRFLSAHQSLTEMWEDTKYAPPDVSFAGSEDHTACQMNWDRLWTSAAKRAEVAPCDCGSQTRCRKGHRRHTADVLALLKLTMLSVTEAVEKSHLVCAECSLAGLESIDVIRDDIINALGDMFVYC